MVLEKVIVGSLVGIIFIKVVGVIRSGWALIGNLWSPCSTTVASVEGSIVGTALPNVSPCWTEGTPTLCVSASVAMASSPGTPEQLPSAIRLWSNQSDQCVGMCVVCVLFQTGIHCRFKRFLS